MVIYSMKSLIHKWNLLEMPPNEYIEYFAPEYKLHLPVSNMENLNTKEYLESITYKWIKMSFWKK